MYTEISRQLKKGQLKGQSGLLTTKKVENSKVLWVKVIQTKIQDTPQFKDEAEKLNF